MYFFVNSPTFLHVTFGTGNPFPEQVNNTLTPSIVSLSSGSTNHDGGADCTKKLANYN